METMIDGIWVCFLIILLLGLADQDGGKKGRRVGFYWCSRRPSLLFFLFTPGVFRFISPYCYTDRCWGFLALVIFVALAAWPCLYLGNLPARIYTYSLVLGMSCYPEPSERETPYLLLGWLSHIIRTAEPHRGGHPGCTGGPPNAWRR